MCEENYSSTECRRNSETCFKRLLNIQALHKTMEKLESGSVVSVVLGAQLRTEQGVAHHESQTAVSVGMKKEESLKKQIQVRIRQNLKVLLCLADKVSKDSLELAKSGALVKISSSSILRIYS